MYTLAVVEVFSRVQTRLACNCLSCEFLNHPPPIENALHMYIQYYRKSSGTDKPHPHRRKWMKLAQILVLVSP